MGLFKQRDEMHNIVNSYTPASTTSVDGGSSTETKTDSKASANDAAEVSSYLDQRRGKVGTVLTSWQGLLDKGSASPKRKTLLGE